LRIWLPVVSQKRNTPRAIKRFGNRIRYLAMLQQGEALDGSLGDDLLQHIGTRFGLADRKAHETTVSVHAVAEHRLVALGALREV